MPGYAETFAYSPIPCHGCGRLEHPHLIDAKESGGGQWERFECIACYGDGWEPTGGAEDLALSIRPDLKPHYNEWLRKEQTL